MTQLAVHTDVLSIPPPPGQTVTVTVLAGDTLYFADHDQVSPDNFQSKITVAQSATFSAPTWLVSGSETDVTLDYQPPVPGASGGWEQVVVPTDEGSWEAGSTDSNDGTWVFPGGGPTDADIQQTDSASVNGFIQSTADFFALGWSLQADIRLDAGGPGAIFAAGFAPDLASAGANNGSPIGGGEIVGPGFGGVNISAAVAGGQGYAPTYPAAGDWHTYRLIADRALLFVYYDSALLGWTPVQPQNTADNSGNSPLGVRAALGLQTGGAASFRNLKAWRIPIPALS